MENDTLTSSIAHLQKESISDMNGTDSDAITRTATFAADVKETRKVTLYRLLCYIESLICRLQKTKRSLKY